MTRDEVVGLIDVAVLYATAAPRAAGPRIDELNAIGATSPDLDPAVLVVEEVLSRIGVAWEHGWQPQDLVHATRRRVSSAGAKWIARAVVTEARDSDAPERAPQPWVDQLEAILRDHERARRPGTLLATGGAGSAGDWLIVLTVLELLRRLPRMQQLLPPPSAWDSGMWVRPHASPASPRTTGPASKTLTKIRALLAKAESTEFDAEAEAFTAKAQDLMTRHAIDEALVTAEAGESIEVHGVRVLIHQPYAHEKAVLLDVIARANRTRAIWFDFGSSATLVGVPTDVEQVEMLFTSMLVQATRAMTHAGQADPRGADRSASFRKAFLTAYATRIGQRLVKSAEEATATYGSDLVPVLARQAEAVDEEFDRLFPHVTSGSRRRTYDARGWDAGTAAADDAVLPSGMVES